LNCIRGEVVAILPVVLEGRILAGRYRLVSQLGRGGMGAVWRAEHLDLGTPAAVKLIDEGFAQAPEALARFRREAQAAASLRSANVVQILDYGIDDGTPYIAMELLEGESLAERLERRYKLEPFDCATILYQVSKALSRAHEQGIIHRDLKPDNIFLVRDGDDEIAKVLDFGIAKRTSALQTSADVATRTGSLMGTPYYMSPEQASGRRQIDQRTDIWAFGVIAYECMTGRRPFEDNNLGGLLLSICTEDSVVPSSVSVVPREFDSWFSRCTAKDPDGRFSNIREAAAELCRICGLNVPAPRTSSIADAGVGGTQSASIQLRERNWQDSNARPSVATPSGVVKSAVSLNQYNANRDVTLQRRSQGSKKILIASGIIAGLGLLSAVTAVVYRFVLPPTPTPVAAVPKELSSGTTSTNGASPSAVLSAPAKSEPSQEPVGSVQSSSVTSAVPSASSLTPTTAIAPTTAPRRVRASSAPRRTAPLPQHQEEPQRLRPQDRLERDLGF
jgi:serine/threonine-protein kinase